ncbi:MAG: AI-2E family transporter [Candidatus Doudnabacteria bacterium]
MFSNSGDVSISTGTLLKITGLGLLLFFLWQVRDVLILLLIAVTLASALEPLVDFLNKKSVPRAVSVLSVYLLAIGFLVLMGYLVLPTMFNQFAQLRSSQDLAVQFQDKLGSNELINSLHLSDAITKNFQQATTQFTNVSDNFVKRTLGFFSGFIEVITILVVSFYLLAEKSGMKKFVYTLVPKEYEGEALHLVNRIQRKIGLWLIGQMIVSAIVFVVMFIVLSLLGVKFALVLAILAGFFELIPYIGPIISAIPAIFFAFLQSPALAVVVLISYVFLQKLEGYVLVPKIMEKTIGVSPLVILVAILIGYKLSGIFGILLAVPIVAVINVVVEEWDTLKLLKK